MNAAGRLALMLRIIGGMDLLAFGAMLAPTEWLVAATHELHLPSLPAIGPGPYLARTASMMYGLCGVLLLFLASDVPRYRPVIRLFSHCGRLAAFALIAIDRASQMPFWWIAVESGSCLVLWTAVGILEAQLPPDRSAP